MHHGTTARRRALKVLPAAVALAAAIAFALGGAASARADDPAMVTISDPALAGCTASALGDATGTMSFTTDELSSLTSLDCQGVTDLDGIGDYTGLTNLDLDSGDISDVSPLASLTGLTSLALDGNHISDLSPLGSLTATIVAGDQNVSASTVQKVGVPFTVTVRGLDGSTLALHQQAGDTVSTDDTTQVTANQVGSLGVSWGDLSAPGFSGTYSFTGVSGDLTPGAVSIQGDPVVFQKLTAVPGTWQPTATTLSYQWTRDSAAIAKATGTTYTLTPADLGHSIGVEVTGALANYSTATETAPAVIAKGATITRPITPVITGKAVTGNTLTSLRGNWTPSGLTFSYRWNRNGSPIAYATGSKYTLSAADVHQSITVTVTGTKSGYSPAARTSSAVKSGLGTITGAPAPTITGTVAVGHTITADVHTWPSGVTVKTQWRRNGSNISGATGRTYALHSNDAGATITVVATGSKAGYNSVSRVSAGKAVPKPAASAPTCSRGTYVNSSGHRVCNPQPTWGPGATYQCNDGWYSWSEHAQGTCSGHGGIKRKL